MKRYGLLFVKYLKPLWPKVALLTGLVFTGIGLQLINPQLIRYFIDTLVAGDDLQPLLLAAALFLGISLLAQGVGVVAVYVGEDVGWRATNHLRADLARHCLRLDLSFHTAHTPGEMIERIDGDIAALANFFSRFVINTLGNLLLLAGILLVLAHEDWRIPLALLAYIVLAFAALIGIHLIGVPYWIASRQAGANLFGFLEEQLSSTEDVRPNGAVAYVLRQLFKFSRACLDKERKSVTANTLLMGVAIGLYIAGQAVALAASYGLLSQGLITIGVVYLIIYYTHLAFQRLLEITAELQNLQQAVASIARVEALLAEASRIQSVAAPVALPPGPLAVVFEDVTFGYHAGEPVLHNVSFQLQPGKTLGVLGRTGSGKTTLTRLLFRLYDPSCGAVRLGANGSLANLREMAVDDLRQRIGLVTQNVQLFNASVRDNVTFFNPNVSDEQLLQALAALGLIQWCMALPHGLDTVLESGGSNLSAGEAQLLAVARVFLCDPGLVILDEASSRLDPATEQLIERAFDKLLENRTGIIVAHRLGTVRRVDHILIIEAGQVQEFGDQAALARDPASRFHQLLQTGLGEVLA
ncbi:MAG TPA: ABC transporter ATP-binding protein [Anaerolineae bacterium]|nr:ABC transporter ATP-binding protein [Anaerolineae bacterium]